MIYRIREYGSKTKATKCKYVYLPIRTVINQLSSLKLKCRPRGLFASTLEILKLNKPADGDNEKSMSRAAWPALYVRVHNAIIMQCMTWPSISPEQDGTNTKIN